jgi:hypothetical protein
MRPFEPAPPTLHRLTRDEYEQTIRDLFPEGTTIPADLPNDTWLHGFSTVGASEFTIPRRDVEQYEAASLALVADVLADPGRRAAFFGCDIAAEGEPCLRAFITRFGRRAWRRPLTAAEIDQLTAIGRDTGLLLRDPWRGAGFAASAILQSPHFLFRVEIGEPDPEDPRRLRYTSWEMASRLSYFIWGSTPDDELFRAAAAGELVSETGIRAQVTRMARDPRARARMTRFFYEFMNLDRLESVSKDPDLFPQFPALRASMRAEIDMLFADFYDRDADVREIFSTDVAFVDSGLATVYGIPDPGPGFTRVVLPASQERGGILGRAAILAMWSHATINSPTHRGKFVRVNLLCQDVPPPPAGISTELPPSSGRPETLRQRLDRHRTDPVCASCHNLMDPLGYTFEHFDPIGRWRELDNGLPIDATGEVDGVPVDGAAELGAALAASPRVGACIARRFFRWSTGHLEIRGELPELVRIEERFAASGYRLRALIEIIALSPAFRFASYPPGDCTDGETRDCTNACGTGVQRCTRGAWTACSAPSGRAETCNGVDDDCDGTTDEGLARECMSVCGTGIEMCVGGDFAGCTARMPSPETCSHADEDCDGAIDEGFGAMVHPGSYTELRSHHPICDGAVERMGLACNMAIHRLCATDAATCGTSGFGPVENSGDTAILACVTATLRTTTFAELAAHHDGCNGSTMRTGDACNAAIHRYCRSLGLNTGFGPVDVSGATVTVACMPRAEQVATTYTEMSAHHGGCTATRAWGPDCNAAIHRFCTARGATSGFGPLEHSGDNLQVACVRP